MRKLRVLVVDDDSEICLTVVEQLRLAGYTAESAENAFVVLDHVEALRWDVVITDLRMPSMDGLEFLREIKQRSPGVEVILITGFGTLNTAIEALRGGAADYLTKPVGFEELEARLRKLAKHRAVREELKLLQESLGESSSTYGLIVHSPAMRWVWERTQLFAGHEAPVLVTGETGTGKELVARALHGMSSRSHGPFVAVASAAIPQALAESELFGHEKGAFTGALRQHSGSFERADGGTLLLDDVDDLPLGIQAKLLRVLEDGSIHRVGGSREISVNVRIVATTKTDLGTEVARGRFRGDLFYRLRGLELRLPPLKKRRDEILILAQIFLRRLASLGGTEPKSLSLEAAKLLRQHPWPGNVRELKAVIDSAAVLCAGGEILPAHLPESLILHEQAHEQPFTLQLENRSQVSLADLVHQFEGQLIRWSLQKAAGQQTRAAEILGLPRSTFQTKLRRHRS